MGRMSRTTRLAGRQFTVIRYLGTHCGAGGQCTLPFRLREAAGEVWRLGLVEIWHRTLPGIGQTGPFYALTDRGRRLAASLLERFPTTSTPPRSKSSGIGNSWSGVRDIQRHLHSMAETLGKHIAEFDAIAPDVPAGKEKAA
jgi:hypothetical protein